VTEAQPPGLGRVLLVEDEPAILRLYGLVLAEVGYSVESVSDGAAAAAALEAEEFDVVLSDLTLPGMSGVELLQLARDRHPDLPLIVMTGGDVEDVLEAMEGHALRCLLKPVRYEILKACVDQAVRAGRLARAGALAKAKAPEPT
jgi:two-component system response regulator AtoC